MDVNGTLIAAAIKPGAKMNRNEPAAVNPGPNSRRRITLGASIKITVIIPARSPNSFTVFSLKLSHFLSPPKAIRLDAGTRRKATFFGILSAACTTSIAAAYDPTAAAPSCEPTTRRSIETENTENNVKAAAGNTSFRIGANVVNLAGLPSKRSRHKHTSETMPGTQYRIATAPQTGRGAPVRRLALYAITPTGPDKVITSTGFRCNRPV